MDESVLWKFLVGQGPIVAVMGACLGLWIRQLLKSSSESSSRIQALEQRNKELSDSLVALMQSAARERSDAATNTMLVNESILRTTLASLESALVTKPRG